MNSVTSDLVMIIKRLILITLFMGMAAETSATRTQRPESTRQVPWGIYQIMWNAEQFERELDQQLSQLGGAPRYVMFFRDLNRSRGFPLQVVRICDRRNLIPIISFEPAPWSARSDATGLGDIAGGRYDAFFLQWGRDAARWGKPVIFRFGFEMNGDWFSWGHKPDPFKKAWRHIHGLFRQAGAFNVKWLFSPNVAPANGTVLQNPMTYYPGDEVVDYVGLDGYNFGDHYSRWHRWKSYQAVFESSLALLSQLNKPLFISEIGCADDRRKPDWIRNFLNHVSQDHRITAFIYYNFYPQKRGYPNWRLDSDVSTLDVFRKWAREQACLQAAADPKQCSEG